MILLGSALFNAFYQIATRMLRGSDDHWMTLFFTPIAGTIFGFAALPFVWQTPDLTGRALFFLIGLVAAIGHLALIKALHWAPAPVAVPFTYLNLVWAIGFGFILFNDLPDLWTLAGAGIIMACGLYILHREGVKKQKNGMQPHH